MKYHFLFLSFFICLILKGQSFYFGPKVGPSLAFQKWNQTDNDFLFALNGDIFIESAPLESTNVFYGSLGYRTRGSAWRFGSSNPLQLNATNFRFRNIVLEMGAKKMLSTNKEKAPYYFIGIRGEYTVNTNLGDYEKFGAYFPNKAFVKKFNYGVSFGGGYEFGFRQYTRFFVEIGIHPDVSQQYYQPTLRNVPDPFFPGQSVTLQERIVRNLSLELKFAMKFLRKVEYY
ncbi:MAG: hypothetical protein U0V54_08230 [Saprospiraceae bacterium]|nr:hypothetical protein [Saprospiraceae bacterium]